MYWWTEDSKLQLLKTLTLQPINLSATIKLRVTTEKLWQFLADTDRLDRAVGLPAINFTKNPDKNKKGYYHAATRFMGLTLEYEEYPYEWIEQRYYQVLRRFQKGPIREITSGVRLSPDNDRTILEVFAKILPRNFIGIILSKTILWKITTKNVIQIARLFEQQTQNLQASNEPIIHPLSPVNEKQLQTRLAELQKYMKSTTLIKNLERYILTASDLEVVSMRPFDLADRWNDDRMTTLKLFLFATKTGVVDLHWTILCPNCRAVSDESLTLAQLRTHAHCETCDIYFNADLASSVEVRFSVNPAIRLARHETYCIGGPANMPQIISQLRLAAGDDKSEDLLFRAGTLRFRCFQTTGIGYVNINETVGRTTSIMLRCESSGLTVDATRESQLKDTIRLTIKNRLPDEALVVVEDETWRNFAATAALVISLQDFRDLFPSEAVSPTQHIGISSLTILFTDLSGSTSFYREIGDTEAFSFVQNHFRYLRELITMYRGGVVKTMGDAIMASFSNALDGLQCTIDMQRKWREFCLHNGKYDSLRLKIGLHQGSAIATNSNGKFDWFGATTNIAARLEKLSREADIVFSSAIKNDPEVSEYLEKHKDELRIEPFHAPLKGFEDELFHLWRMRLESDRNALHGKS